MLHSSIASCCSLSLLLAASVFAQQADEEEEPTEGTLPELRVTPETPAPQRDSTAGDDDPFERLRDLFPPAVRDGRQLVRQRVAVPRARCSMSRGLDTIIDRRQLRERAPVDMFQAIEQEVGVLVQRTQRGAAAPFIRGLTGQQVLILVDGIRLNNATFRQGPNQYFNTIDPGMVERIEVLRGPQSVLYGADAIGGGDQHRHPAARRIVFVATIEAASGSTALARRISAITDG